MATDSNTLSYDDVHPITVNAPWGHFSGECWGNKDAKIKVLLVHGRQHNAACFSSLIPLLPHKDFYYVCLDLPGHGQSSPHPPGLPLNYFHYVYSVKIFVDVIGWDKFVYIGHSMGGMMGSVFCSTFPERVLGFIALDSATPFGTPASRSTEFARRKMVDLIELESRLRENPVRKKQSRDEAMYKIENGPNGKVTPDVAERILLRSSKFDESTQMYTFTDDPRLKLDLSPVLTQEQINNIISSICCPTLIVLASGTLEQYKKDRRLIYSRAVGVSNNKTTIDFKLVIVNGDHFVHINDPEKVAPHVSKFLNIVTLKSSL